MFFELGDFFQLTPIPSNVMKGTYNLQLVALSYAVASLASFVALDATEIIRRNVLNLRLQVIWIIIGAFTMGMGIWTMHFIGMLAFVMEMPMDYNPFLTALSMVFAMLASAGAFFLIKNQQVKLLSLIGGGVLIGLGIVSMHYTGMTAMMHVKIHYLPSLFFLSILIAIATSEAALWLMIRSSNSNQKYHLPLKLLSALVMGLAICGMHYTGMAAAVFIEEMHHAEPMAVSINPNALSYYLAGTAILIIIIALGASRFWLDVLWKKNQTLLEAEAALEQKSHELESLNTSLKQLAENSIAREEKISAILTAAADGIIVTDEAGKINICNLAASKIFGIYEEEMISTNIIDYIGIFEEGKLQKINFAFLLEKERLFELKAINSDGNSIPIELNHSKSTIGNQILYICILRDITERKNAEEKLNSLNQKLMTTARLAGMAEVAACVLHNVGNVLNSINVSSQVLLERDSASKVQGLKRIADIINDNKSNLTDFIKNNSIGINLASYLSQFADYWENEEKFISKEITALNSKIQHIKNIIVMQQMLSSHSKMIERVQVKNLIEDALSINSEGIERYKIKVVFEVVQITIDTDKVKILQILVNLIKNAVESIVERNQSEKKIIIQTKIVDVEFVSISIIDNGIGIPPESLTNIFAYGFTTKNKGHGFGLHSAAVTLQEMGGTLNAYSEGKNQGAKFEIILPMQINSSAESLKSVEGQKHGK